MNTSRLLPLALSCSSLLAPVLAQITPGNLVVLRVGDGSASLTNAATAVFLDEYTTAGAYVQTVALPTAASGAQRAFACSGTATSEGALTQSVDGNYLIAAGYGAAPGTASIASTSSSSVRRVLARIGLDGTIDTSTGLSDAYSGNNVRGATSWYGGEFWTAGTASATNGPGVRFAAPLGASTSTQLNATITNIRRVDFFAGQLYCSSAAGSFFGVGTVGSGAPTGTGETIALLPGMPTASGPSPYDFFFADADTLYVADDRTTGAGGIQKWTQSGGVWSLQYTLSAGASVGCRGLSGSASGGTIQLFATTTDNRIVGFVDAGAGSSATTLVTGAANTALRGLRFVRFPASVTFSGVACITTMGSPSIGTGGGEPVTGNATFEIRSDNSPPGSLVLFSIKLGTAMPIGVPIPGAPPCIQIYVLPDALMATVSDAFGASWVPLPIPAGASFGGAQVAAQAIVWDPLIVGYDPPIGQTEAMQILVGN
jgi:hypothetical protein